LFSIYLAPPYSDQESIDDVEQLWVKDLFKITTR